jgi:hypothetical protein
MFQDISAARFMAPLHETNKHAGEMLCQLDKTGSLCGHARLQRIMRQTASISQYA